MILNSLKDSASIESLHPLFKKAFDYIKATDFSKVPAGKIVLDGDNLYISVAEPTGKTKETARMETHDKYIDIQMPLTAVETMGWKATNELKEPTAPYNPEKDITFFADKPTTRYNRANLPYSSPKTATLPASPKATSAKSS